MTAVTRERPKLRVRRTHQPGVYRVETEEGVRHLTREQFFQLVMNDRPDLCRDPDAACDWADHLWEEGVR